MTYQLLLAAHIAVLGYWLGADLCINSEYRFITHRDDIDFAARDAMTDHLMNVDQHVRYALILQVTLGAMLASELGYFPEAALWIAPVFGVIWIALVEIAHRSRKKARGPSLARADRVVRYIVALTFVAIAIGALWNAPNWLGLKLALFALLIGCGVAIRFFLMKHNRDWSRMRSEGSTPALESLILETYRKATGVLLVLWACIAGIVALALFKPF